jgi:hypothetical protein
MTPITLAELRTLPQGHYVEYNGSDILVSDLLEIFEARENKTRRRAERKPRKPRQPRQRRRRNSERD